MGQTRPWKAGDLVRLRDTGQTALIIKVADAATLGCKMIKIHSGEYLAPWKLDLVSKSEERRKG